ncbi:chemotaxis protein [Iodobacter sp. LRB]|uniref:Chemotaxis protein CheV n=2 Tax=Iodobacter TaxID=32014 RepID=A0A377Q563_9NEIS|nr:MULTISPECIES: chemotaxis protein [Iodobacter]NHQ86601.1 chemotaxis protein CheV [Iodobacter violacea]PHV01580.1 fused signal transduction protein/response regulator [Iodobacter sp. BJB302]TCU87042.1 two-component system chemotaxis response regulator CheV [Iodobacter fluviatilis]STQ90374.1 Chemotaxis protein CheV [Iodobacter fluviatilis]
MSSNQTNLLESIDARTKLAGSNKMEILLFTLGTREIFGINVFKVREVSQTPKITKTPNMPLGVEGVLSLRGNIIPVIALAKFVATQETPAADATSTMIVTEFSKHTQAFLVHEVDRIIRVDWDKVRAPETMLAGNQQLITALTELPDGKLVSILDVEQILASVIGEPIIPDLQRASINPETFMFFVDDSMVARKEIISVLDKIGVKYHQANNGREAWDKLQNLANRATHDGERLREKLKMILVDAEMPEMDGYVLTKHIKSDNRFQGIPIVMHSSLSSNANRAMGSSVGVDAYVAKFDPVILADTITPLLVG